MTCCSPQDLNAFDGQDLEEARLRAEARCLSDQFLQSDFLVPGMHCAGCIRKIEDRIGALPFVSAVRANLSTRRITVTWDGENGQARELLKAIEQAGFESDVYNLGSAADEADRTGNLLLTSLGVAGFASANIMLLSVSVWSGADGTTRQLFHLISALIAVPAVAIAGRPFYRSALSALRKRQLNMDVPISLAVLLSLIMSVIDSLRDREHVFFDASVMLLFFLLIGRYLDYRMREKARGAVSQLSRLAAKGAAVLDDDGKERFLPLENVVPGMVLRVRPGERIPIDGVIQSGRTDLDRSLVTGESEPVAVDAGAPLEAGTVNLTGPITMNVTKTADQSFLAEVTSMMEAAERGKARVRRIADSMARIYAPAVHLLSLFAFVFWMTVSGGDWHLSVYIAISVLIITCPCALGLAVPIVHVVAANQMFRRGIFVKDGAVFERFGNVDWVVFDKTGTLTIGEPVVATVSGPMGKFGSQAAALAEMSTHPAAKAVSRHLVKYGRSNLNLTGVSERPGEGVEATLDGIRIRLGRRQWVEEISVGTRSAGNTKPTGSEVCFASEKSGLIEFRLHDKLRPEAAETIAGFQARGAQVEILSGDHLVSVQATAEKLGISNWFAEQRPSDKVARIQRLSAAGHKVLVVGDGINDAPALAAAYVSVAPSSGSDVGRLASDLVFTGSSLGVLLKAQDIAAFSNRLVKQNFGIALAYNCVAVPLAFLGYVTPLVAALAMSGSSIVVVANSLRLNLIGTGKVGSQDGSPPSRQTKHSVAYQQTAGSDVVALP